jgi:hypothetical protein
MREEQDVRGWSDASLAKRISRHYPMSAATVWKLKNANPSRGLSLDEAKAIATAFEYPSIDAMLESTTVASFVSERLVRAAQEISDELAAQGKVFDRAAEFLVECQDFTEDKPINVLDATDIQVVLDYLVFAPDKMRTELDSSRANLHTHVEEFRRLLQKKCPGLPPGEYANERSKKEK